MQQVLQYQEGEDNTINLPSGGGPGNDNTEESEEEVKNIINGKEIIVCVNSAKWSNTFKQFVELFECV